MEVKLSERITVEIEPLNAWQQIQADELFNLASAIAIRKTYSIASIKTINGKEVSPLMNKAKFAEVAQQLNSGDLLKLRIEYEKLEDANVGDDLKNEIAAFIAGGQQESS